MSALGRGTHTSAVPFSLWRKKKNGKSKSSMRQQTTSSTCVGMSGLARRLPGRWEWENGPAFIIIGKNAASREFIEYRERKRMDTRRRGGMKYSDDDADRSKACAYPTLATTIRYHIIEGRSSTTKAKKVKPTSTAKNTRDSTYTQL